MRIDGSSLDRRWLWQTAPIAALAAGVLVFAAGRAAAQDEGAGPPAIHEGQGPATWSFNLVPRSLLASGIVIGGLRVAKIAWVPPRGPERESGSGRTATGTARRTAGSATARS